MTYLFDNQFIMSTLIHTYKTSNFYLASYLIAKNALLAGIDRLSVRCEFILKSSEDLKPLIEGFNFAREDQAVVKVDARKMITAIKGLKEKLYQI